MSKTDICITHMVLVTHACVIVITLLIVLLFCLLLSTERGYTMAYDCISYIYGGHNDTHRFNETHHFNETMTDDAM